MTETLFGDTEGAVNQLMMECFRSYIARLFGPSPFDFRGRPFMSKEKAEQLADDVVRAMKADPKTAQAVMKALYEPEDDQ